MSKGKKLQPASSDLQHEGSVVQVETIPPGAFDLLVPVTLITDVDFFSLDDGLFEPHHLVLLLRFLHL
jgi:hypothetical protein